MNSALRTSILVSLLSFLALPVSSQAQSTAFSSLSDRQKNPWMVTIGTFAGNGLLGSALNSSNSYYGQCGSSQLTSEEIDLFQSLGLEFGVGYNMPTSFADFRLSERLQTFGLTNNQSLGQPNSVLGMDALFRAKAVYFGPGFGMGYRSAPSGFTFQGQPHGVFSAVVGVDAGDRSFAEARLQASPSRAYQVASVDLGFRF